MSSKVPRRPGRNKGSVAAPTASLHFDAPLLDRLADRGVAFSHVTLHVGAGTFLPVKVDQVEDHLMHSEYGEVSADTCISIAEAKAAGGRVTRPTSGSTPSWALPTT